MVNGRYFWNQDKARVYAMSLGGRQIIRNIDYKKLENVNDYGWCTSLHPDADNYNTNI
jgi:hypothetical protein